ncbi:hypothetical protein ACFST9_14775 [Hymenobacter monticola]|uniref:Uncharacterized protein n=1 Tax=Hymenobacter monticola TaxID=1705399 RepID=A0ABY4B0Z4_9BACT|nr:hypothetical protein [Hymenobacter monticola]UOE32823.1 hypothetical protein MTP16_17010 [Hymenobacter monticola]
MEEYEFVPDPPGYTPPGSDSKKPVSKVEEELNMSRGDDDPYGFAAFEESYSGFRPEMTADPQITEPHFIPSSDYWGDNFFNPSESEGEGDYNDNLDMDQQSQEYWDSIDPSAD